MVCAQARIPPAPGWVGEERRGNVLHEEAFFWTLWSSSDGSPLCGMTACSGLAHPHFGLPLGFSFHRQWVLQPGRQVHVLTERESGWAGVCSTALAAGAFRQTCHFLYARFMMHSGFWFSRVHRPRPLHRQWAEKKGLSISASNVDLYYHWCCSRDVVFSLQVKQILCWSIGMAQKFVWVFP